MAWIESHQSLARHRKTLAVMAVLKVDRHKLIGHLHELWWWGLDNADVQGHVGHVTEEVLAAAAGWPVKDARRWVAALLGAGGDHSAGFLDADSTGYVLHDWEDYAGKLNDQRELRRVSNREAQRRRRQRLEGDDVSANGQHANDDMSSMSAMSALTVSTGQHPTGPDRTGPTVPDTTGDVTPPPPSRRGAGKSRKTTTESTQPDLGEGTDAIDYEQIVEPNGRVRRILVEKATTL